jgi:hypothetical protein
MAPSRDREPHLAGAASPAAGAATARPVTSYVASFAGVTPVGSASRAAAHPQQRQLAVTTLSGFKVVLTATRSPGTGPGPAATVTAAGYRHTPRGWKLIAAKRIGKASGWSWYATEVCSLTVNQLKPEPSSAAPSDTITVRARRSAVWGPTPSTGDRKGDRLPEAGDITVASACYGSIHSGCDLRRSAELRGSIDVAG